MKAGNYYTGTSGLLLPVPNKTFYPEEFKSKSRLCYYGSLFNSLEINSSFYKVPMTSTIAKWAADVPDNFRFTFKLFRDITHQKGLEYEPGAIYEFMERISAVGSKKGCLLIQFPASIKPVYSREVWALMRHVIAANAEYAWNIAVEFRHATWYTTDTYDMLEHHQLGLVIHDKLQEGFHMIDLPSSFVYLRFHGPEGNYKGSYESDLLEEYATYVQDWMREGKDVYAYFNNTMGEALKNANTLRSATMA